MAANNAGLRLLRMADDSPLPAALDAAMPALRRLREIDASAETFGEERLTFWCGGRLVRVAARISRDIMNDGRSRLIVRALHGDDEGSNVHDPSTATTSAAGPVQDAPRIERDDRETLREIARRIREGHRPEAEFYSETSAKPADRTVAGERGHATTPSFEGTPLPVREPTAAPDARTLSKIAHELKTPLSAIAAAAEIMRDEQLGPMGNAKYLGYAGDIFESARHALDVINAMLTGTAKEARTAEPVDLSGIAAATVSVMMPLAEASGINLEADTGDERLSVTGDATAIRQIIYNLISNALKFTPHGGEVHVVTGYLPKGVPFMVVRDTGEGMSEDDIVRAFYRDDSRIGARSGGGYGIGLPMVRRLAEMMNATIDVDSEPGKGTVVLVSFPNAL